MTTPLALDRIAEMLTGIQCDPYEFKVTVTDNKEWYVLFARFWRQNIKTGKMGWGYSLDTHIPAAASEEFVVKQCLKIALGLAEHEVREAFRWRDRRIFDPHVDINNLWEIVT